MTGDVVWTSASFDGSGNVTGTATIQANSVALGTDTTGNYVSSIANGSYLTGGGASSENKAYTLGVDATSANTASKVVARDASGNFSAGTITAALTGNASTATTLQTARTINGVSFNGSANITVADSTKVPTSRTVSAGSGISGGGALSGNITISHADTSSQGSSDNSGRTYIQDVTLDTYGHVTGLATATETVTDTTYSAGSGLDLSGTTFSVESDLRGEVFYIGRDTSDYINVSTAQIEFWLDGNEDMRLENDGDLHVDGNVIAYSTTISDERLKTDIVKIDSALDKVDQINGYTFTYTADGKKSAGVIAQEVEKVLPSAITESTLPLKMGEDDKTEYKTVQYDQLIGLLVEAIKELKAEVAELKGK
jgi:hypothetical protein